MSDLGRERSRLVAAQVRKLRADDFASRTLSRFARLLHGEAADGGRLGDTVDSTSRFATLLNEHNRAYAGWAPWATIPTRRGHLVWQPTQVLRVLEAGHFARLKQFKDSFDVRTKQELLDDITERTFARLLRAELVEGGHFTLEQVQMGEIEYRRCRDILDSLAFNSDECPSYGPGFICNRRYKRYRAEHTIYLFDLLSGRRLRDLPANVHDRGEQRRLGIIGTRPGPAVDRDPWASRAIMP